MLRVSFNLFSKFCNKIFSIYIVVCCIIQRTTIYKAIAMTYALTTESIHAMADKLSSEGKYPTLALLRQELGSGSYTTISEAMKLWREEKAKSDIIPIPPIPHEVSNTIQTATQSIWQSAMTVAENKLQAEREALKKAQDDMAQRQKETIEMADHLDQEIAQLKQTLQEAVNAKQKFTDDNDRLKTELINIKKDLSVANTHITKLEKQTDGATAKMMQAIEERSNLKGQVEALEKSLKAITLSSEKSKK